MLRKFFPFAKLKVRGRSVVILAVLLLLPLLLGACSGEGNTPFWQTGTNLASQASPPKFEIKPDKPWDAIDFVRKALIDLMVNIAKLLGSIVLAIAQFVFSGIDAINFTLPESQRNCSYSNPDSVISIEPLLGCSLQFHDITKFLVFSLVVLSWMYQLVTYFMGLISPSVRMEWGEWLSKWASIVFWLLIGDLILTIVKDLSTRAFFLLLTLGLKSTADGTGTYDNPRVTAWSLDGVLQINGQDATVDPRIAIGQFTDFFDIGKWNNDNIGFTVLLFIIAVAVGLFLLVITAYIMVVGIAWIIWIALLPLSAGSTMVRQTEIYWGKYTQRMISLSVSWLPVAVIINLSLQFFIGVRTSLAAGSSNALQFIFVVAIVFMLFIIGFVMAKQLLLGELRVAGDAIRVARRTGSALLNGGEGILNYGLRTTQAYKGYLDSTVKEGGKRVPREQPKPKRGLLGFGRRPSNADNFDDTPQTAGFPAVGVGVEEPTSSSSSSSGMTDAQLAAARGFAAYAQMLSASGGGNNNSFGSGAVQEQQRAQNDAAMLAMMQQVALSSQRQEMAMTQVVGAFTTMNTTLTTLAAQLASVANGNQQQPPPQQQQVGGGRALSPGLSYSGSSGGAERGRLDSGSPSPGQKSADFGFESDAEDFAGASADMTSPNAGRRQAQAVRSGSGSGYRRKPPQAQYGPPSLASYSSNRERYDGYAYADTTNSGQLQANFGEVEAGRRGSGGSSGNYGYASDAVAPGSQAQTQTQSPSNSGARSGSGSAKPQLPYHMRGPSFGPNLSGSPLPSVSPLARNIPQSQSQGAGAVGQPLPPQPQPPTPIVTAGSGSVGNGSGIIITNSGQSSVPPPPPPPPLTRTKTSATSAVSGAGAGANGRSRVTTSSPIQPPSAPMPSGVVPVPAPAQVPVPPPTNLNTPAPTNFAPAAPAAPAASSASAGSVPLPVPVVPPPPAPPRLSTSTSTSTGVGSGSSGGATNSGTGTGTAAGKAKPVPGTVPGIGTPATASQPQGSSSSSGNSNLNPNQSGGFVSSSPTSPVVPPPAPVWSGGSEARSTSTSPVGESAQATFMPGSASAAIPTPTRPSSPSPISRSGSGSGNAMRATKLHPTPPAVASPPPPVPTFGGNANAPTPATTPPIPATANSASAEWGEPGVGQRQAQARLAQAASESAGIGAGIGVGAGTSPTPPAPPPIPAALSMPAPPPSTPPAPNTQATPGKSKGSSSSNSNNEGGGAEGS